MMKIIPYYAVVNLEAFILCFSGEYLSSKVRAMEKKDCEISTIDVNCIINFDLGAALIGGEHDLQTVVSTKLSRNYTV